MKLSLRDKMPFGKYKGKTIKEIIENDPQYLYWACENITEFALSTEAQEKLPHKKEIIAYLKAKRACSDMRGLSRALSNGPSGEYAQLTMDDGPIFNDSEDGYNGYND